MFSFISSLYAKRNDGSTTAATAPAAATDGDGNGHGDGDGDAATATTTTTTASRDNTTIKDRWVDGWTLWGNVQTDRRSGCCHGHLYFSTHGPHAAATANDE